MKAIIEQALTLPIEQQYVYVTENGLTLNEICEALKSKDSILRDQLAPHLVMNCIQSESVSEEVLKGLVEHLISEDFLFNSIGTKLNDTIFIRSNAALWLTIIFQSNNVLSFLTGEEAKELFEKISTYLYKEKDVRGFVEEKGWANAITNAMNLYITIVQDDAFEWRFVPTILAGISKAIQSDYVFVNDEEAKFAHFIQSLTKIDYPEDILIEWIEQLYDRLQYQVYEEGYTPEFYKGKTNLTHTMQATYFKLKFSRAYPKAQATASIFLSKWA